MLRQPLIAFFLLCAYSGLAQYDSTYYTSYDKIITGRFYFSQKYTSLRYRDLNEAIHIRYRPNTTLNMGVGATYKWATLNLAYGFGFLNNDAAKGKTKYLDLQTHVYGRKILVDGFGQFYNGFYMNNSQIRDGTTGYYIRPDIKVRFFGISGQYVFNHKRFSYRSSFLQSEWQKKSAGSLLAGLEFFTGYTRGDSALIPAALQTLPQETSIERIDFVEVGPNIGYVYTFVWKKHFFATGQATVSLDYGTNSLLIDGKRVKSSSLSPNSSFSFFAGYNSKVWAFSFVFVNKNINLTSHRDRKMELNTGNLRFNIVHRFVPRGKTRAVLKKVIK
ncbi:MAG TPA: DUF4421 domain-containing protein [Ohtaekwangia sp.]|uniref:DUF4421 domain-containing protein n=1 Tax=Ohtaekwangia sp. TaxID=2066019 RepID=UPI002F948D89